MPRLVLDVGVPRNMPPSKLSFHFHRIFISWSMVPAADISSRMSAIFLGLVVCECSMANAALRADGMSRKRVTLAIWSGLMPSAIISWILMALFMLGTGPDK